MADSTTTAPDPWTDLAREEIREVAKTLTDLASTTVAGRTYFDNRQLSSILREQTGRLAAANACLSNDTYVLADLAALVGVGADQADDFTASDVPHVADQ